MLIPQKNTTFAPAYTRCFLAKPTLIRLLRIALALCAYAYLLYRLIAFDGYAALWAQFAGAEVWQYLCLALCVALMPLNMWLEARKWQYLMRPVEPMTMCEAQVQVYYGMAGAFVTPYRAGDYPARVLLLRNKSQWVSAIGLALVGSIALTVVIVLLGLPAVFPFFAGDSPAALWTVYAAAGVSLLLLFFAPVLLLRLAHLPWRHTQMRQAAEQLARLRYAEFARLLWLSLLRYLCFSLQMWLALRFCGVAMSVSRWLVALPLYYLLVTISPNIPAADFGIRGSWAIYVFGRFAPGSAPACAMAVLLMWGVNTALPVLVGTLLPYISKGRFGR